MLHSRIMHAKLPHDGGIDMSVDHCSPDLLLLTSSRSARHQYPEKGHGVPGQLRAAPSWLSRPAR